MTEQVPKVKRRYRIRWPRLILVCFVFLLFSASVLAGSLYYFLSDFKQQDGSNSTTKALSQSGGRVNILALGVDDGEYENSTDKNRPRRSDSIMLISIDPTNKRA